MKKVLFVFAIAAAFAACNNSGESATPAADSTKTEATATEAAPAVDSTKKDSTATAAPAADSTKKDSTAKH